MPHEVQRAAFGDLSDFANRHSSKPQGWVSDPGSIRQQLLEDGPDPVAPGSDVRGAIRPTPEVTSSPLRLDIAARPADKFADANGEIRDGGENDPPSLLRTILTRRMLSYLLPRDPWERGWDACLSSSHAQFHP